MWGHVGSGGVSAVKDVKGFAHSEQDANVRGHYLIPSSALLCSAYNWGSQRIETRLLSDYGVSVRLKNLLVLRSLAVCSAGSSSL